MKDLVGELKRYSSKWIKTKGSSLRRFYWQAGYGAFSVSPTQIPAVKKYIREQEEHHKEVSFKEEILIFLKKYIVNYDERYIGD